MQCIRVIDCQDVSGLIRTCFEKNPCEISWCLNPNQKFRDFIQEYSSLKKLFQDIRDEYSRNKYSISYDDLTGEEKFGVKLRIPEIVKLKICDN